MEEIFQGIVEELTNREELPRCEWEPWEFAQPKQKKFGDLCSYTVIKTISKHYPTGDASQWCAKIVPEANSLIDFEVSSQNGVINLTSLSAKEPEVEKPREFSIGMDPIGYLESCFKEKFGTPRQSLYCSDARGVIKLYPHINEDALLGLEEYSHVWVISVFHLNQGLTPKSKIRPPRHPQGKLGVLATRSPHRFNPISLSVLEIMSIRNREISVRGVDMIDGTPILDIKPYHPADCITNARFSEFTRADIQEFSVDFNEKASKELEDCKGNLKFYNENDDLKGIVSSCLAQDPSTIHTKLKHADRGLYAFCIDLLVVVYVRNSTDRKMLVVKVCTDSGDFKLRSKEWLKKIREEVELIE